MHCLTVEAIRLLIKIGLDHADEIDPDTGRALDYCLSRMERYAPDDWIQIRDLHPLLLVVRRHTRTVPPGLP